jgi:phosphatidylinositol glycan class T
MTCAPQVVPLRQHLAAQRVQPAVQRASPGVLDLCLQVPAAVAEVQLRLDFSKVFLTVFEYPPDAHRGFDIPAALVSYPDPLHAPTVQWRTAAEMEAGMCGGAGAGGDAAPNDGDGTGNGEVMTPLLTSLSQGAVKQVRARMGADGREERSQSEVNAESIPRRDGDMYVCVGQRPEALRLQESM